MLKMHGKKLLAVVLSVTLFCLAFLAGPSTFPAYAQEVGTSYYIDASAGSDANDGKSSDSAWKTLDKVNATEFQPGDKILFKAGESWEGVLHPKGSGDSDHQIAIDMYGKGNKPHFDAQGKTITVSLASTMNGADTWTISTTVWLDGQDYWTISDLDVSNTAGAGMEERAIRQGIWVRGKLSETDGVTRGIKILNNDVHDVKGQNIRWNPTGYDMYSNAAIYVSQPGPSMESRKFDDLLIEGNHVENTVTGGIKVMEEEPEQHTQYFTKVIVRKNYVSNVGSDGIIISHSIDPLIEYNTVLDAGGLGNASDTVVIAGLWITNCNDAVLQYNEVARTRYFQGDGQAFDTDWGNSGVIIHQYNYTHDNQGGFFMNSSGDAGANGPARTILRYNISENDGTYSGRPTLIDGNRDNRPVEVYNNIFYNDNHGVELNPGSSSAYEYKNNIFYSTGGINPASKTQFDSNCYAPVEAFTNGNFIPDDSRAIVADPKFVNLQKGTLDGYKLQADSPLIDAGLPLVEISGYNHDYFGTNLTDGLPDIGVYEFAGTKPWCVDQRIEAEDFSAKSNALQVENCPDGGQDICNTSVGQWLKFENVDLKDGAAKFEARVSAGYMAWDKVNVRGRLEIRLDSLDGTLAGTLDVNSAGTYGPGNNGWEFYRTESCKLSGASGIHDIYLKWVNTEPETYPCGCNINWFRFVGIDEAAGTYATGNKVEAENYSSRSIQLTNEDCTDVGGGYHVRGAQTGAYLAFENFDFGNGTKEFEARVQTGNGLGGGTLEIYLDDLNGTPIGTATVSSETSGWQTVSCQLPQTTGQHTVYLKWNGEAGSTLFNLNWFKFKVYFARNQKIEAESYSEKYYNIQTEPCKDEGGGLNICDTTAWANIKFENVDFGDGVQELEARVAAADGYGGTLEVYLDTGNTLVGSLKVNPTGGWQNWETIACRLNNVSGVHDVTFRWWGDNCSFNLNWIRFNETSQRPLPESVLDQRIEAEDFSAKSNALQVENCPDGGQDICNTSVGQWLKFENVDLKDGAAKFEARVSAGYMAWDKVNVRGRLEIRLDSLDGTLAGTLDVNSAGTYGPGNNGWEFYRTESCKLSGASGIHDIYLKWVNTEPETYPCGCNINWFRFVGIDEAAGTYATGNKVEAENYSSRSIQLTNEDCTDVGGGYHVRGAQTGAYLAFENFDFGNGTKEFEARVQTGNGLGGGTLEIYLDDLNGTPIGTATVSSETSGWQTVSCQLPQTTGQHTVYLKWNGETGSTLFNLNWFKFNKSFSCDAKIEAEDYSEQSGDLMIEKCQDVDDGDNICNTKNGSWLKFSNVDLADSVVRFEARVAAGKDSNGGQIEVRLDSRDSVPIGAVTVTPSGNQNEDWQKWQTVACNLTGVSGQHDVYLTWVDETNAYGVCNLNWVMFKSTNMVAEEAAKVNQKIEAIGEVTLDSENVIKEARAAYEALSEQAKEKVTKLDVL